MPSAHGEAVSTGLHWGPEPYYGSGTRQVWVYDQTGNDQVAYQVRRWIGWMNVVMAKYLGPKAVHYNYYRLPPGPCSAIQQAQTVCLNSGGEFNAISAGADKHMGYAEANLYPDVAAFDPAYVWNTVCHEFGHGLGLDHPTYDDGTCMTNPLNQYSTVERFYSTDQWVAIINTYNHPQ